LQAKLIPKGAVLDNGRLAATNYRAHCSTCGGIKAGYLVLVGAAQWFVCCICEVASELDT
jgi:hypothetical protein